MIDVEGNSVWDETDEAKYREAIEHFKKNPYMKEVMEAVEDLEKTVIERRRTNDG